jgi:transcriptional regulator with XRE-family HTH domain
MIADMSKRIALGKAIKAIREAKDLPGSKVATDCLMSHSHLLNIESGHRQATPQSIDRIAAALGVELDAISYVKSDEVAA